MSNTKAFELAARVPFYLFQDCLTEKDAALVASVLLTPGIGLIFAYHPDGHEPNDHGGQTAMFRLVVEGVEALSWPLMERFALILKNCHPLACLYRAHAKDLDAGDGSGWAPVVNPSELSPLPGQPARPALRLVPVPGS